MHSFTRTFTEELKKRLKENLGHIQVVIGPRQVGKTTALLQIVSEWKGPTHMVTADEVAGPSESWIHLHWNRAQEMGANTLLVFDEIQKVRDWSRVIKVRFDEIRHNPQMKIVLLGSASLSIQQGLSESLAGRFELTFAPHWHFLECKEAFGWDIDTYITFGGYPAAAAFIKDPLRWENYIKNSIIEPVLSKDILMVSAVHKPALFRQCFELAMAYPAQEVSLTKLLGQLQDSGNVTTLKHYLALLEGAFLVKSLQKYSGSKARSRLSSPKLVPLNNALPHALHGRSEQSDTWQGRLFETAVGAHLSQFDGELFYFRDGNFEVDYILKTPKKLYAIEVKSKRKAREHRGLEIFLRENPKAIPVILDRRNAAHFFSKFTLD